MTLAADGYDSRSEAYTTSPGFAFLRPRDSPARPPAPREQVSALHFIDLVGATTIAGAQPTAAFTRRPGSDRERRVASQQLVGLCERLVHPAVHATGLAALRPPSPPRITCADAAATTQRACSPTFPRSMRGKVFGPRRALHHLCRRATATHPWHGCWGRCCVAITTPPSWPRSPRTPSTFSTQSTPSAPRPAASSQTALCAFAIPTTLWRCVLTSHRARSLQQPLRSARRVTVR